MRGKRKEGRIVDKVMKQFFSDRISTGFSINIKYTALFSPKEKFLSFLHDTSFRKYVGKKVK
jgi:hypothetical protein